MGKEKEETKQGNSMVAASEELSKLLIKLYKSKSFTHAGKSLADMLFKSGIEAGSLISGISELTERQAKINAANQAILQLNQTAYIANVMQMADFYRASQVKPLTSYVRQVINALRELLISVPEPIRKIHVQSNQPVVQFAQVTVTQPAHVEVTQPAQVAEVASTACATNVADTADTASVDNNESTATAANTASTADTAKVPEEEETVQAVADADEEEQLSFDLDDDKPAFSEDDGFNDPMPLMD
jgi:hypothetical protein